MPVCSRKCRPTNRLVILYANQIFLAKLKKRVKLNKEIYKHCFAKVKRKVHLILLLQLEVLISKLLKLT